MPARLAPRTSLARYRTPLLSTSNCSEGAARTSAAVRNVIRRQLVTCSSARIPCGAPFYRYLSGLHMQAGVALLRIHSVIVAVLLLFLPSFPPRLAPPLPLQPACLVRSLRRRALSSSASAPASRCPSSGCPVAGLRVHVAAAPMDWIPGSGAHSGSGDARDSAELCARPSDKEVFIACRFIYPPQRRRACAHVLYSFGEAFVRMTEYIYLPAYCENAGCAVTFEPKEIKKVVPVLASASLLLSSNFWQPLLDYPTPLTGRPPVHPFLHSSYPHCKAFQPRSTASVY
ncbi:hypothetical protein FB451DRAFT_1551324, partial [Mycena latifolia]